jgi:hypothetical protein
MSDPAPPSATFRLSLREFFALIAAIVAGCAALRYANDWWLTAVGAVTLVALMASVIVAVVDRGSRQAFAIGFAACMAIYATLLAVGNELNPWAGRLPTTRLLAPVYESLREQSFQNAKTGEFVLRSQLPAGAILDNEVQGGRVGASAANAAITSGLYFRSRGYTPPGELFMPIAHCLWALALGYVGGHFGRHVYARRVGNLQTPIAPASQA